MPLNALGSSIQRQSGSGVSSVKPFRRLVALSGSYFCLSDDTPIRVSTPSTPSTSNHQSSQGCIRTFWPISLTSNSASAAIRTPKKWRRLFASWLNRSLSPASSSDSHTAQDVSCLRIHVLEGRGTSCLKNFVGHNSYLIFVLPFKL